MAMKAYVGAKKQQARIMDGTYKVEEENHFLVHVQGLLGKLPRSEDIQSTVGEHYDMLSAFQTYFMFEGEIYTLTTYSCPLEKYATYMLNEIDCYLVLGNEHLYLSRKDCDALSEMIVREDMRDVVMLHNQSKDAGKEAWPKQMEKEADNINKNTGAVKVLKDTLIKRQGTVIDLEEFSNRNIALIFNHILKTCILHRKATGGKGNKMLAKIEENGNTDDSTTAEAKKKSKKCSIF